MQYDPFARSLDLTELSQTGRKEFLRLLSSQNLQLASLRIGLGARGFGPGADVEHLIDRVDKVLQLAAGLGGPVVCVDLGPLPEPPRETRVAPNITADQAGLLILPASMTAAAPATPAPPPPPPSPADVKLAARVDESMAEIARRADRVSAMIAFGSDLSSLAALERAVRSANCSWFGVELDAVSLLRDDWSADEAFSRLASQLRHVRARDAVLGSGGRTQPTVIGRGTVNWDALLGNLRAADYRGWVTVDPTELTHRLEGAEAGLKQLAGRMLAMQ